MTRSYHVARLCRALQKPCPLRTRLPGTPRATPALVATPPPSLTPRRVLSDSAPGQAAASCGDVATGNGRKYTAEEDLDDARRVARETFGVEQLLPEQEAAIAQVMAGENTLVVGPFKSGMSLFYLVCHPCWTMSKHRGSTAHPASFPGARFDSTEPLCQPWTHTGLRTIRAILSGASAAFCSKRNHHNGLQCRAL